MDGQDGLYGTTDHMRGRSMSLQHPVPMQPQLGQMQGMPVQQMQQMQQMQPQSMQPSMQYAQQPYGQWSPQQMPGLYQLVPVDGSHPGAHPGYQQQHMQLQQHQQYQQYQQQYQPQPQVQHQQHQPQQPFYTMPNMAMSPASPTPNFVSPVNPLRRQVSLGIIGSPGSMSGMSGMNGMNSMNNMNGVNGMNGMNGYYQPQPDHTQQHTSPQNSGVSAPGPMYMGHYAASPHMNAQMNAHMNSHMNPHISPMPCSVPNMTFSTPPSVRHMSIGMGSPSMPLPQPQFQPQLQPQHLTQVPAIVPRALPATAEVSTNRMRRQHRPKPLLLSTSAFGRASRESRWISQDTRSLRTTFGRRAPSVTPVGSDRDYDAGGSSYSSSPVGSETNHTSNSGSYRNYVFGLRSETSEAGTDGPAGGRHRLNSVPRTIPRMYKYTGGRAGHDNDNNEPPSPTPRARTLRPSHGKSRLGLLQSGLSYHNGRDAEAGREQREQPHGVEYSSSDELYTTSDSDPIRRRHRHRVATDGDTGSYADDNSKCDDNGGYYDSNDDAQPRPKHGHAGFCNCGMRQCFDCGLFISRPESHECMVQGSARVSLG